jgi:tRNA threonylcarbamoyl adenosine modification protein YjeE
MIESAAESLDIALPDLAATERLAQALAGRAAAGDIVALWGGLGAGKTTFARAFIHARPGGAGVAEVPSPTFTLVQVYDLADAPVWHFDLYRLTNAEDAWELGIEEAFTEAVSLIEWPDRLGPLLPERRLDLHLNAGTHPDARQARLVGHGDWSTRLENLRPHA